MIIHSPLLGFLFFPDLRALGEVKNAVNFLPRQRVTVDDAGIWRNEYIKKGSRAMCRSCKALDMRVKGISVLSFVQNKGCLLKYILRI